MKRPKTFYLLLIVLVLSLWAIRPLFIPGFFPIHDDTQVARVFEMKKALSDGMFPVRWVADLGFGYGYPIFNFYAPLAYYVGGLFNLFGFDALASTKIMIGIGMLLAGVFMYFLAREFFGELGGIVSAIFYMYAPYHALNLYVRGAISELWAYGFVPLMFLGLYKLTSDSAKLNPSTNLRTGAQSQVPSGTWQSSKLQLKFQSEKWKWVVVGSIGYAGVILSHNLTAMMVTPFIVIILLVNCFIAYKRRNLSFITYYLSFIILGLMLSAFYWVPAIFEMHYTNVLSQIGGGADFRDHFVCIAQLWDSPWGFGGSTPGCLDGMSFIVGKLHLLAVAISILLVGIAFAGVITSHNNKLREKLLVVLLSMMGFLFAVFFTLDLSKPVWEFFKPMRFFQYPWRFLLMATFFSSLIAGFPFWFLREQLIQKRSIRFLLYGSWATVMVLILLISLKLFQPQTIFSKNSQDYTNVFALKWAFSKISYEYMPKNFQIPNNENEIASRKFVIQSGQAEIQNVSQKTQIVLSHIDAINDMSLLVQLAYFPSWRVYVDGMQKEKIITNKGFAVFIPQGAHDLKVVFEQTPLEKLSNFITLVGTALLIAGIIYSRGRSTIYEKTSG